MPSNHPFLVSLRGDEAYARYLDELARLASVPGRNQVAELALRELGSRLGLTAPRRLPPHGRWPRRPAESTNEVPLKEKTR